MLSVTDRDEVMYGTEPQTDIVTTKACYSQAKTAVDRFLEHSRQIYLLDGSFIVISQF